MCLQLFNAIVMYLNALIMPYKYEYLYWCKMFQCTVVFLNQCKKHGFVWLSVTVLHNIVCVCACAHATTCMSILVKMICVCQKKKNQMRKTISLSTVWFLLSKDSCLGWYILDFTKSSTFLFLMNTFCHLLFRYAESPQIAFFRLWWL